MKTSTKVNNTSKQRHLPVINNKRSSNVPIHAVPIIKYTDIDFNSVPEVEFKKPEKPKRLDSVEKSQDHLKLVVFYPPPRSQTSTRRTSMASARSRSM